MGNEEAQAAQSGQRGQDRAGSAGMEMSVRSARPSWRVASTPLVPVLSLWLTQAKFIAARCNWTGSITTVPWEPGKMGQTPSMQL